MFGAAKGRERAALRANATTSRCISICSLRNRDLSQPTNIFRILGIAVALQLAHQLSAVGLGYVGPSHIAGSLVAGCPSSWARRHHQGGAGLLILRQDVQDIVIMRRFRLDIFCRDPRRARSGVFGGNASESICCQRRRRAAPVHFRTTFGGLTLDHGVIADIVAALADGPRPFAALMALKNPARLNTRSVLCPCSTQRCSPLATPLPHRSEVDGRFNAAVARASTGGKPYTYLAAAAARFRRARAPSWTSSCSIRGCRRPNDDPQQLARLGSCPTVCRV